MHPICLTRAPGSGAGEESIPSRLADDYYLYAGANGDSHGHRLLLAGGASLRRGLARLPPSLAQPTLDLLRRAEPRVRRDGDARLFLSWAEKILRRRDTRLVHAQFGPVAWRMLTLTDRLRIPLVVSFLGGDDLALSLPRAWWWWVQLEGEDPDWPARMRELFARGDLFLAEGPHMRARLIEFGCPSAKIKIQRIAIPVGELPFRERGPRSDEKTRIVFAGRLCDQKGVLYALEAVRQLREERRDFQFKIIGDGAFTTDGGAYAARVHAYVRRHDLRDCVDLLGFMDHARYLRELARGDVFLHPSVVDDAGRGEGGAPTTILEAQALGMPVLSTTHCDIPYVTRPGVSAVLVPERDSRALAQALGDLLDEPARWGEMGRAGRRHVERFHDVAKETPRLEDEYLRLVDRARRPEVASR